MSGKDSSEVEEAEFLQHFQCRYICTAQVSMTDGLAVKGGKTIRKLDVNEVVETIGVPIKDGTLGLERVQAKAEKDDKEGFITLSGNQGTKYLAPCTAYYEVQKLIEALGDEMSKTSKYIDTKTDEL